jgi:hypothetical protein
MGCSCKSLLVFKDKVRVSSIVPMMAQSPGIPCEWQHVVDSNHGSPVSLCAARKTWAIRWQNCPTRAPLCVSLGCFTMRQFDCNSTNRETNKQFAKCAT